MALQIDENVERELINHRTLVHPNIVKFREVRKVAEGMFQSCVTVRHSDSMTWACLSMGETSLWGLHPGTTAELSDRVETKHFPTVSKPNTLRCVVSPGLISTKIPFRHRSS